jgi:hypothetical protein
MPTENTLLIRDPASLALWRQHLRRTLHARRLPYVQVRLPGFTAVENVNLSVRASHLQQACGCGTSGLFMSTALVAMLLSFFGGGHGFAEITVMHVASLLGGTVLAGLCGKAAGLLWARWQLLAMAEVIHARLIHASSNQVHR